MFELTESGLKQMEKEAETRALDRACFGDGLWLDMRGVTRRWVFRFTSPHTRREREFGLGTADSFRNLNAVRVAHGAAMAQVEAGVCPTEQRKQERATVMRAARVLRTARGMTLQTALERTIERRRSMWRSPKTEQQWMSTFERHVLPRFGSMAVSDLQPDHIADMLTSGANPWSRTPVMGERLQRWIEIVIDHADAVERRTRRNPAHMAVLAHLLPAQPRRLVRHHAAPEIRECAAAFAAQTSGERVSALAVALVALTAVRVGSAVKARWADIDFDQQVWNIPRPHLKSMSPNDPRNILVIPLSQQALNVLRRLKALSCDTDPNGFVLPSPTREGLPLHPQAALTQVKRNTPSLTLHGWRAAFATVAVDKGWGHLVGRGERPYDELLSIALDHSFLQGKAWLAYQRGALLDRRRNLMQLWADFLIPQKGAAKRPRRALAAARGAAPL